MLRDTQEYVSFQNMAVYQMFQVPFCEHSLEINFDGKSSSCKGSVRFEVSHFVCEVFSFECEVLGKSLLYRERCVTIVAKL